MVGIHRHKIHLMWRRKIRPLMQQEQKAHLVCDLDLKCPVISSGWPHVTVIIYSTTIHQCTYEIIYINLNVPTLKSVTLSYRCYSAMRLSQYQNFKFQAHRTEQLSSFPVRSMQHICSSVDISTFNTVKHDVSKKYLCRTDYKRFFRHLIKKNVFYCKTYVL